jgi:V8-like Glu-specific endopeptidase
MVQRLVSQKAMLAAMMSGALALPATALALSLRHHPKKKRADVRRMGVASDSDGVPEVGALYANNSAPGHGCTAAVVHTRIGNLLVTAAHCVAGNGAGMVFDPGEDGRRSPYGRWTVTAAYLEPKWLAREAPQADVAFLTVAPQTIDGVQTQIEQVTGAYELGFTATRGDRVNVTGYPGGPQDDPVTCTTSVYRTRGFPSFDCRGFVGGTSGSPWLRLTPRGAEIVGVIGGLNQGGCHDYTSYSSPLAAEAHAAYRRAADGARADVAPQPDGDGC